MTTGMPPLPPSLAASSRTTIGGRSSVPRSTASVHYTLHNAAPKQQQQQQHGKQHRSSSSSSSSVHSALHRRSFSSPRILRVHSGSSTAVNGVGTAAAAAAVDANGFSASDIEHFYPLDSKPTAVVAAATATAAAAAAATAVAVNGSTGKSVVAVAPVVHVHHHGDDDIRM
jgi:hypothetical protein